MDRGSRMGEEDYVGGVVKGDSTLGALSPSPSMGFVPLLCPLIERERPGGWQAGGACHRHQANEHHTQPQRNRKEAGRMLDGGHQVQCDRDTNQLGRCHKAYL